MKRSILGLLLILCLALLLPAAALAGGADEGTEGAPCSLTEGCSRTEGCTLPDGHEGECVVESPQQPCSRTEGCTLPDGHEDECVVESPQQPCSLTEGCTLPGGHEDECVVESPQQPCSQTEGCPLPGGHDGECVVESPQQPCIRTEGCTLPDGHEDECVTAPANEAEDPLPDGVDPQLQSRGITDDAVCSIGDVGYTDFATAMQAATDNQKVKLEKDFTVDQATNITISEKKVTLDLNGHTVTSTVNQNSAYFITVGNGGSLTVCDTTSQKEGCIKIAPNNPDNGWGIELNSGSSFTMMSGTIDVTRTAVDINTLAKDVNVAIKGGTIRSARYVMNVRGSNVTVDISAGQLESIGTEGRSVIYLTADDETAVVNITGGTLSSTQDGRGQVISGYNSGTLNFGGKAQIIATDTQGITIQDNIIVNITGGEISVNNTEHPGRTAAVSIAENTKLKVAGGKITSKQGAALQAEGSATAEISSGEFISESKGYNPKSAVIVKGTAKVTIKGGSFSDSAEKGTIEKDDDQATVVISGGEFSSQPDAGLLEEGLEFQTTTDGTFIAGSAVAQIVGKSDTYFRLSDAVAVVQPGETIRLLEDVQLADNTALQFDGKGTENAPVTLDLNGHDITGSNSNTRAQVTVTANERSGILWISQSHVVLTDSSADEKGSIVNKAASANNCTVLVTAPQATDTTSLQVRGGITINNESSHSSSKVLSLYSGGDTYGETWVTLEDVTMSSKENIITASDKENLKLNIKGGTYRTQATGSGAKTRISNYEGVVSISGGTFINANIGTSHLKRLEAGCYALYSETEAGQQKVEITTTAPADYAVHLRHADDDWDYRAKVYLAAGQDLNLLENLITDGVVIEVAEDLAVNLEKVIGKTYGAPDVITFELAQGVTLSGELKLQVADVIISGQGNLADDFTCTPASADYTVSKEKNANIWHGQMLEEDRALKLTKADGSIVYYPDSSTGQTSAFTAAGNNPGSTLQLQQDITCSSVKTIEGQFSIDLNGHVLTLSKPAYFLISATGNLQLINTNEEEGVLAANKLSTVAVSICGGSLSIGENVKVTGNTILLEKAPRGKLTVAGTIDTTGTANAPIMGNGSGNSNGTVITIAPGAKIIADATLGAAGIYHPQDGTLIINGGEISGDSGIYMKAGTLQMNGGKVTGSGPEVDYNHKPNGYVCTGDAIVLDACGYPGGAPAAEIKGGEISSKDNQPVSCYLNPGAEDIANKQFISGGKFSGDVSQYIAAQHSGLVTQDADYPFWVGDYNDETAQQALENKGVARLQVNQANVYYTSLQKAVAAAGENAVITLIADTDEVVTIGKPLVVMRNGFTASQISADADHRLVTTEGSYLIIPAPAAGTTYTVKYYLENKEQTGDAQSGLTAEKLSAALDKTYADHHLLRIEGPGADNTYHVYYARNVYQVTVQIHGRGTAEATPNSAISGNKIQLSATAQPGYRFAGWRVLEGDVTIAADGSFTMPQQNVTVLATFTLRSGSSSSSSRDYYQLRFDVNGGNAISALRRVENTTIDLNNYTPVREGYRFTGWYADAALSERITSIRLTEDTTVYAGWQKITQLPFLDIDETDSYYDAVCYVYENGLIIGTSDTLYSPDMSITRGMIATILWRVEGKPAAGANPFPDVAAGSYYESAIAWAAANGVINGYEDGNYRPNEAISREELAAILYRYALNKGYASAAAEHAALTQADAATVLDWAVPAMQWACETGVLSARADGLLQPGAEASRAETAVAFYVLAGTLAAR